MFKTLLFVGAGGFLGSIARFLTSKYIQLSFNSPLPWGTFIVNILGCFILGLLYGLFEKNNILTDEWRLFLTIGFCGGFTTFSAFANENISMLRDMEILYFFLYAGFSIFAGIMAVYLGNLLIKVI